MSKHYCGPLEVDLQSYDEELRARCVEILDLFSSPWKGPFRKINMTLKRGISSETVGGTFLNCGRMTVDVGKHEILATTTDGVSARADLHGNVDEWQITVPQTDVTRTMAIDLEHSIELALTTGWRLEGWVPVHAGAVQKNGQCAILCAPSNGGKSTLVASLLRNGWRTLGDDKLLLRQRNGVTDLVALHDVLNLHPETQHRFVGEVYSLPQYSAASEKRRVPIERIAGGAALQSARPTHIVQIARKQERSGVEMIALAEREAAIILLRQIVVPNDRTIAAAILQTVMKAASTLKPLCMNIGSGAYEDSRWIKRFEDAF
ncbi:MAG: hypothetical protein M3Z14_00260 [Candidatus Eremiobacteraeota bacterium]|nr:hypothetical protein [Candidatus Eremiobacteraeota bacterium]